MDLWETVSITMLYTHQVMLYAVMCGRLFVSELPLIRQFKHGQSNPTYYIEYGGAKLVLRKKPVSHTVEPSIRDTTELRTPL